MLLNCLCWIILAIIALQEFKSLAISFHWTEHQYKKGKHQFEVPVMVQ